MGQRAPQVLGQRRADLVGKCARVLQLLVEVGGGLRQPKGLHLGCFACGILAQQHEIVGVGDQHQPIQAPVLADLVAIGGEPRVIAGRLDLHDPALRKRPLPPLELSLGHLLRGVQAEIGMVGALLGQLADAEHPGFQGRTNRVQQVGQRRVVRRLGRAAARRPYLADVVEVVLDGSPQSVATCRHVPPREHAPWLGLRCSTWRLIAGGEWVEYRDTRRLEVRDVPGYHRKTALQRSGGNQQVSPAVSKDRRKLPPPARHGKVHRQYPVAVPP